MKKYKKAFVEITNVCNLSCTFCPKTKRESAFMEKTLFRRILLELKGRTEYIYFHIMGEPLLHPALGDFLDLCYEFGFKVNITTNGTLMEKAGDTLISKPALRMASISLHSFEANESSSVVDRYLDEIFSFIRKAREEGRPQVFLRLWNLSEGAQNKNNKHIQRRITQEFALPYSIEDKLTPCNGIKLGEKLFLSQAEVFDWPAVNKEIISREGFCYGLRDQFGILVDGTVVPCCLDCEGAISLGNIKEQSLEEILTGERSKELFDGFSRRKAVEELCQKCGYRARFNR